jgi:hypothetical protein
LLLCGATEVPMGNQTKRRSGGEGDIGGVQGEGNREADRRYREGAKRFAESGRVKEAAREAAKEVDEEKGGSKRRGSATSSRSRARRA